MTQPIAQLEPLIIDWAKEKGLILHTKKQALKQHGKTEEEIQEFLEAKEQLDKAIVKKCESGMWAHRELQHKVRLEAGDVLVTLVIQCAIQGWGGVPLAEAMEMYAEVSAAHDSPFSKNIKGCIESLGKIIVSDDLDRESYAVTACAFACFALKDTIRHYELTLDECLEAAWLKIRDRKGETIDGVFVKTEDLLAGLLPSYQIGDELSGLF